MPSSGNVVKVMCISPGLPSASMPMAHSVEADPNIKYGFSLSDWVTFNETLVVDGVASIVNVPGPSSGSVVPATVFSQPAMTGRRIASDRINLFIIFCFKL